MISNKIVIETVAKNIYRQSRWATAWVLELKSRPT